MVNCFAVPTPPIKRDELRAIQIHRRRRGVRTGDEEIGGSGLRAHRERVRRRGGEVGKDDGKGLDAADVIRLQLQHERAAQCLHLHVRNRGGDGNVIARRPNAARAGERRRHHTATRFRTCAPGGETQRADHQQETKDEPGSGREVANRERRSGHGCFRLVRAIVNREYVGPDPVPVIRHRGVRLLMTKISVLSTERE